MTRRRTSLSLLSLVVAFAACSSHATAPVVPTRVGQVSLESARPVARIDERYLTVAVDMAQVVGASFWNPTGTVDTFNATEIVSPFDFTRPRLRRFAQELSPGRLRVGGTEADRVYYDLSASPVTTPPAPYKDVLTSATWDSVNAFAIALGFDVMFTINAGAGPRDADGSWTPDNATTLLNYTEAKGYPVALWELGNEVNMYPVSMNLSEVTPAKFANDVRAARALIDSSTPGVKLGAPSSMYWPRTGEALPFYADFMAADGGVPLDVITWHYYPTQSDRCPLTPTPDTVDAMFDPATLNEIDTWAEAVESQRDAHAPDAAVWLGETGNAQCGGEPGVSDAFAGGFFWLDELGRVARRGEPFIVRQTLSGSSYGLLDDVTLTPRPDYWTSVLWRRVMGTLVLNVPAQEDPLLRVYAHCTRAGAADYATGAVTLAVLNLDRQTAVSLPLAALASSSGADVYELSSQDLGSGDISLNGVKLIANGDGSPPPLAPRVQARAADGTLDVLFGPATYGFIVLPGAAAAGCP